jgi:hypothetical protein
MRPSEDMERIVERVRYRVADAVELAHDAYWDGNKHERNGRNTYLYRSKRGRYFAVHLTMWQGERNHLQPLTAEEAYELYEELPEKTVPVAEAFPDVAIEEA